MKTVELLERQTKGKGVKLEGAVQESSEALSSSLSIIMSSRQASKMKDMKVVLFWVDSGKVSTEAMDLVNAEDRYIGAPTTLIVNSKPHRAIVRLISGEYYVLYA